MKGHATNAGGFTLIETTIAMVVMMVVGLGATSLFLYSIRNNSGGANRSQALAIAQQRIELLRELPYNDPELAVGQTTSTVVLQNVTPTGSSSSAPASAGLQAYGATASGNPLTASSKSGKGGGGGGGATPTPTPGTTPTPGGGTGGGAGGGGDTYKVVLDIQGLPAGSTAPTQKRITITVTPENGHGQTSWINQNPVVIVLLRSSATTGPYRL
ncbi:MAG TPA: prepilin-type N-terminal cleavage/methylation domain-containing protein [Pyrinomonadaceae bacterium]